MRRWSGGDGVWATRRQRRRHEARSGDVGLGARRVGGARDGGVSWIGRPWRQLRLDGLSVAGAASWRLDGIGGASAGCGAAGLLDAVAGGDAAAGQQGRQYRSTAMRIGSLGPPRCGLEAQPETPGGGCGRRCGSGTVASARPPVGLAAG